MPLTLSYVYDQVQQQLLAGDEAMAVMVDTSDSMLRTHTMKLPEGTPYELQVGWGECLRAVLLPCHCCHAVLMRTCVCA